MGFLDRVHRVISEADVLIEVIDARFPSETRNEEIEKIVKRKRKHLIIAINKSDLISKNNALKIKKEIAKDFVTIFISSTKKSGILSLRKMLTKFSAKEKIKIGILGYPNVGKSSVINALCGRHSAKTSITAGYTRGEQLINLGKNIQLIDLPGIIPFNERDQTMLALIGAKSHHNIKDIEAVGEKIIQLLKTQNPKALKDLGVKDLEKDEGDLLEEIAFHKNRLLKKGKPDVNSVAKMLLFDWQKGKLK
ncbi:MAG: GTPase [archaeon]|nr:GTPase [archaeon]